MLHTDRKLVAIAVPLSDRNSLSEDEKVSLWHLEKYLSAYDRYFIMPESLDFQVDGFKEKRFHSSYFGSVDAHRKLLFSRKFYETFQEYGFLLIYHLDALVFSDQLKEWCNMGFDYVAPPWIKHPEAPYSGNQEYEGKVGNGGFSLRKIDSFLSIIDSKAIWQRHPVRRIKRALRYAKSMRKYYIFFEALLYNHYKYNGVKQEMDAYVHNEDHFWPNRASHYHQPFKVAPVNIALQFAFECVPRHCYELNDRQLPFGCHAWNRYDPEFWKPFMIPKTAV
jgi:hypothetical protein